MKIENGQYLLDFAECREENWRFRFFDDDGCETIPENMIENAINKEYYFSGLTPNECGVPSKAKVYNAISISNYINFPIYRSLVDWKEFILKQQKNVFFIDPVMKPYKPISYPWKDIDIMKLEKLEKPGGDL